MPQDRTFLCSLPGAPALESIIVAIFSEHKNWHRVDASASRVDLAWVPYSQVTGWGDASGLRLSHQQAPALTIGATACMPVRTALVSKASLGVTLATVQAWVKHALSLQLPDSPLLPALRAFSASTLPTFTLSTQPGSSILAQARQALATTHAWWVIKLPHTNNGLGVYVVQASEVVRRVSQVCLQEGEGEGEAAEQGTRARPDVRTVVLQPYAPVDQMILLDGLYKFHIRVNVLLLGNGAVLVHRDAVVHRACEPLLPMQAGGTYAHLTNNGIQRTHPSYTFQRCTMDLSTACTRMGSARGGKAHSPETILDALGQVVQVLFAGVAAQRSPPCQGQEHALVALLRTSRHASCTPAPTLPWLTHPAAFEVFGLDFLLTHGTDLTPVQPILLEVNAGPALESRAWPDMCKRVVSDTLHVVLPWLGSTTPSAAAVQGHAMDHEREEVDDTHGTRYVRVL